MIFISLSIRSRDIVLRMADSLYVTGNNEEAITEYKRFLFFNPDSKYRCHSYYRISMAYRKTKNWEKSLKYLELAEENITNDSIIEEMKISKAIIFIALKDYVRAERNLLDVKSESSHPEIKKKASFFRGISFLYNYKWEEARKSFNYCFKEEKYSNVRMLIDSLLSEGENLPLKSENLAAILSVIPGLGQIYTGNYLMALNALGINSLNGYLIVNCLRNGELGNAALVYIFLFNRYYKGNLYKSYRMAEEFNRRQKINTIDKVLNVLYHYKCK